MLARGISNLFIRAVASRNVSSCDSVKTGPGPPPAGAGPLLAAVAILISRTTATVNLKHAHCVTNNSSTRAQLSVNFVRLN